MVLVGGDFNLPDIPWLDGYGTTRPNPAYGCEINILFLNIIDDNTLDSLYIDQPGTTIYLTWYTYSVRIWPWYQMYLLYKESLTMTLSFSALILKILLITIQRIMF